jgi:hypothetical protein
MSCSGTNATIIQHCATFGNLKTQVRKFYVSDPKPYAQYDAAIDVSFVEGGKRRPAYFTITSDNRRWLTIEADDGRVLYDSRTDVPCDMKKWEPIYQENKAEWLGRQAEIDRENAAAPPGVHTEQMGNFRD